MSTSDRPTRAQVEVSSHDHGNCELCDQLEREHQALLDAHTWLQADRNALRDFVGSMTGYFYTHGIGLPLAVVNALAIQPLPDPPTREDV